MYLSRRNFVSSSSALLSLKCLPNSLVAQVREKVLPGGETEIAFDILNLFDYEAVAREKFLKPVFEYITGGAADEITLGWNRLAYDRIKLMPRVLMDVTNIDSSITIFGQRMDHPILLAPTALHRAIHPDGEIATSFGANQSSSIFVLSTATTVSVEDVARVSEQPLWFQLYLQSDKAFNRDLIRRVEEAGCRAVVVTVDSTSPGARNRQSRSRFSEFAADLKRPHLEGIKGRPRHLDGAVKPLKLTWEEVEDLKSYCNLPIVLKGVLNPLDAEEAVKRGIDGIIVSNHGARILDTVPATIEVLPRIIDKIDRKIPVLVDGGVRRGTDVLKAIALGATAVLIGRPYLYALGVGGSDGVANAVGILVNELQMAMALSGRSNLSEVDRALIWK